MTLRIRPPGARTDAEVYDPASAFDLVYQGILKATVNGCRHDEWPGWLQRVAALFNVDEVEVSAAVDRFVQGILILKREPLTTHPDEAFARSGWNDVREPVKLIIYARHGQLTVGAFWTNARHNIDLPLVGVGPSASLDQIARLAAQNVPKT